MRQPDRSFLYNPEPDFVIEAGMTLVVMGESDQVVMLRKIVGEPNA